MGYKKRSLRSLFRPLFLLFYALIVFALLRFEEIPELTSDAPVSLYANQTGDDLKKVAKEAMRRAKESITLVIYSLTDAGIIELLNERAQDGIKILIIHDKTATPDIRFRLHDSIKLKPYKAKGLMHDKLLVIDAKEVWFGSTNFTRESFMLHANQMLGVSSKEFAEMCEKKAHEMYEGRRFKAPSLLIQMPNQTMDFFFLPESTQAFEKLLSSIHTAKKACRVAMYTFTHPAILAALVDAKKRGVHVEVVIDGESALQTSRKAYERLKREKVAVFRSTSSGLLHHKMMIVDDMLVTGSANWTKAAFQSNDDCIAFISPLTAAQSEKLEKLWQTIRLASR